jgi:hypothetical protein
MIKEPLTAHERYLIEKTRKVNKLLSLYVLALQERKPLTVDEHGGLARALRGVADVIEQEGACAPNESSTNAQPPIEGSIETATKPDGPTAETVSSAVHRAKLLKQLDLLVRWLECGEEKRPELFDSRDEYEWLLRLRALFGPC